MQREILASLVSKLLQSGGAIDLKKWVAAIDLTADRAGFLLAHDLGVAAEVMRATEDAASVAGKERVKEIVLYSISEPYLELREKLADHGRLLTARRRRMLRSVAPCRRARRAYGGLRVAALARCWSPPARRTAPRGAPTAPLVDHRRRPRGGARESSAPGGLRRSPGAARRAVAGTARPPADANVILLSIDSLRADMPWAATRAPSRRA